MAAAFGEGHLDFLPAADIVDVVGVAQFHEGINVGRRGRSPHFKAFGDVGAAHTGLDIERKGLCRAVESGRDEPVVVVDFRCTLVGR